MITVKKRICRAALPEAFKAAIAAQPTAIGWFLYKW